MTRTEAVRKVVPNYLQAIDATKLVSNIIADEIEAYAAFLELENDLYGLCNGLRKAASIARNYRKETE